MKTLIQRFSALFNAYVSTQGTAFRERNLDALHALKRFLPIGSGINSGVCFDVPKSTPQRLVFGLPFHPMNESGGYGEWVDYNVIVTPTFSGFDINIDCDDYDLREYLTELLRESFNQEFPDHDPNMIGSVHMTHKKYSVTHGEMTLGDCKLLAEAAASLKNDGLFRFFAPNFITAFSSLNGVCTEHKKVTIPLEHF